MTRYHDKSDLSQKVEWEGGVSHAIFDYGITADELPDETPDEVRAAWERLQYDADHDIQIVEDWLCHA